MTLSVRWNPNWKEQLLLPALSLSHNSKKSLDQLTGGSLSRSDNHHPASSSSISSIRRTIQWAQEKKDLADEDESNSVLALSKKNREVCKLCVKVIRANGAAFWIMAANYQLNNGICSFRREHEEIYKKWEIGVTGRTEEGERVAVVGWNIRCAKTNSPSLPC